MPSGYPSLANLPLMTCSSLETTTPALSSPNSTRSKGSQNNDKIQREYRQWKERIPIPAGVSRSDISAHVSISSELQIEDSLLELANEVRDISQEILGRSYNAPKHSAKYHLRVLVMTISDGGMVGTMNATSKSFTWLGEAVVTLAWRLYSTSSLLLGREAKMYDGGMVTLKQLLNYGEFFDTEDNHGIKIAKDVLASECAYEIMSQVGIGNTKFYTPKSTSE